MAEWRGAVGWVALGALLVVGVAGCFWRDPLDPRGELGHRDVQSFDDAERAARSRAAFERARERVRRLQTGMNVAEAEGALEAIVVTQRQGDAAAEEGPPRRKFIEGFLCRRDVAARRQRWLFGYDEGGVELVGFALEWERDDPEKEKWFLHSIDRNPSDDCPEASEGE